MFCAEKIVLCIVGRLKLFLLYMKKYVHKFSSEIKIDAEVSVFYKWHKRAVYQRRTRRIMSQSWNTNNVPCILVSALLLVWHLTSNCISNYVDGLLKYALFSMKSYCINALTLVQFSREALKRPKGKRKENKRNDSC